jgi:magnesium and cobalt exporter, CNNM family
LEANSIDDYHSGFFFGILAEIHTSAFSLELIFSFVLLIILLFGSAMVSGAEVAFFSLDHNDKLKLKEPHSEKNNRVLKLLASSRKLLATILIANNLFNIGIIITAYYIIQSLFEFNNPIVTFLIESIAMTFIIVLFGEVMPKVYANYHNIRFARFMSMPLLVMQAIFNPLSMILVRSTTLLEKRLSRHTKHFTKEELDKAIDIATEQTATREEKDILKSIVQFGDIAVKQIMRSRMDIVAIDDAENFKVVYDTILKSGFSRIPVYHETLDDIIGLLYTKDLLNYLDENEKFNWKKLLRKPFFVPENKKIEDLLKEFQNRRVHLAIVVDEYGGTSGIVTLEDIMEEIIGDIVDEYDEIENPGFEKIDELTYIFEGKTLLNDFCREWDIAQEYFDEIKGDADSVAGLMLELFEKIPQKNEKVSFKEFTFEAIDVSSKQIIKVKVTKQKPDDQ